MASTAVSPAVPRAGGIAAHLWSLFVPLYTLGFVLTGPHPWHLALLGSLIVPLMVWLDDLSAPYLAQPSGERGWAFEGLLLVLAGTQFANIAALGWLASTAPVLSPSFIVSVLLVGLSSAAASIVLSHELIHRRGWGWRLLGRALLVTVFYEHFYTEHIRGHHKRVGTTGDPATARFGESFGTFLVRTVPAQFASAWRLEASRLKVSTRSVAMLRSRVAHGVLAQVALLVAAGLLGGPAAAIALVLQAAVAVMFLEDVNYFEHWGLMRQGNKPGPRDAWDSDSALTHFSLIGLSRHSDHHMRAAAPYSELLHIAESPKLPSGYYGTAMMVLFRNRAFRAYAIRELKRQRLGPFTGSGLETQRW